MAIVAMPGRGFASANLQMPPRKTDQMIERMLGTSRAFEIWLGLAFGAVFLAAGGPQMGHGWPTGAADLGRIRRDR
jgi:hypothetical protein